MKRSVWLLASLLAGAGGHAQTTNDYAWTFPIETGTRAAADANAWRVELTPAVYAWVHDANLSDIAVFNAAGKPVPAARYVDTRAPERSEHAMPLPVLALPTSPHHSPSGDLRLIIDRDVNGHLRRIDAGEHAAAANHGEGRDWLLDASAIDRPLDHLALAWNRPVSGVVAHLRVEASDDLQNWRQVVTATVLVLDQDGAHLEHRDIALGHIRAKYLRLHRLDDGVALAGLNAEAWFSRAGQQVISTRWLDAKLDSSVLAADAPVAGVTYYYDLPVALPVRSARIELPNDNGLAPLTLAARVSVKPASTWIALCKVTAFRLRYGDQIVRNSDVPVSTTARLREFRIDSTVPLAAAPRLSFAYRPDELVFLAEGNGPYTLAVGSVRAHRPDYPLEAALAGLRAKLGVDWQPPLATLGPSIEGAGGAALQPLPAPPMPTPWKRWLLWGVLIAAAALVGVLALSLLRGATSDEGSG